MRKAILDIGTNSIKCLIAVQEGTETTIQSEKVIISRLGEGLVHTGFISPMAFAENLKALRELRDYCVQDRVDEIRAIGTMALRTATNADEFIETVRRDLGIYICVISGAEEARLSYLGAISSFDVPPASALVFDTGGGSTELIHALDFEIHKSLSITLGAHHLKHLFGHNDPVTKQDFLALRDYTRAQFSPYLAEFAHVPVIIGIGGTPVSLAAVHLGQEEFDPAGINGTTLQIEDLDAQINLYKSIKDTERKKISGLPPQRSDLILFGAVIVKTILELCDRQSFIVSAAGIRHGALFS